jgi:hypothetical protein
MHRPLLALVVLVAALPAGCTTANQNASAGEFEGAERDVAQVIDELKGSRDPEEICSRIFTDEYAKSLEAGGRDCVDEVQATLRDVGDTDMDVRDVTVEGTTARAEVRQGGRTATFELERGADGWQISSLGT